MKASDLRIGNTVAVCYEDYFEPAEVVVLEPDVVHISNRKYPDSDRDIIGVPLCENWLVQLKFSHDPVIDSWSFKDAIIKKLPGKDQDHWIFQIKGFLIQVAFVHELQNLLHALRISG